MDQKAITFEADINDVWQRSEEHERSRSPKVRAEVLVGYPAEEIVTFTETNDIDLIFMATHGRSGLRRWVLGSVAAKVLRRSTSPICMVPAGLTEKVILQNWPYRTILVPLDGSDIAARILSHVEAMAKLGRWPVEVILIQVCEDPFLTADYPEANMPMTWSEHVEYI